MRPDDQGPARAAVVSLSRVIVERLDSLTSETRQTLVTAALLGPVFSVGDLAVVSGRAPTELVGTIEEAVAAAVLESAGARLRFRHGLLRQGLYESVPLALRVALHQHAISALIAADVSAERVAELLLPVLAEADGWELGWIVEHGGDLIDRAPEIAAELLGHALDRLETGDRRRAQVQDTLLPVSFYLRRVEQAERIARDILSVGTEPARAGRAYWFLAHNHMYHTGKVEEALTALAEASTATGSTRCGGRDSPRFGRPSSRCSTAGRRRAPRRSTPLGRASGLPTRRPAGGRCTRSRCSACRRTTWSRRPTWPAGRSS